MAGEEEQLGFRRAYEERRERQHRREAASADTTGARSRRSVARSRRRERGSRGSRRDPGESDGVGERGSWKKNMEGEAEAEHIFVSLESDEKPEKLRRSRGEGGKSEKQDEEPLRVKSASTNLGRPMKDLTAERIWSDVDPTSPVGNGQVFVREN
ncbi:unnamed protein product [Miscanthus lutarioriparius]|uniref:Uncharacterized protein n=1 Tax=Miscanthus lutarioriparius TaxID=422564 RepID=A0A811SA19_9POAL|nr:unnamed protein product [Miscanthus lutarioriparius]